MSVYTHTKKLRQNDSWGKDINTNIWKWGFGKNIWAKYGLSGRRGNVRYWVVYCTGVSFVFRGSCSSICCCGGANCWVVQNVTRMEGNICVGLWVRAVVKHVLKGCEVENEVNGWPWKDNYGRYNTVVAWRTLLFRDTELLPAIFVPRLRTISYRTVELWITVRIYVRAKRKYLPAAELHLFDHHFFVVAFLTPRA
jgi:hypothetical protein